MRGGALAFLAFNAILLSMVSVWIYVTYGSFSNLFKVYLDRNVGGHDVVEVGSHQDARTQRHGDWPYTAVNPYTVHVKLGGWGGKRIWVAYHGEEYISLKLELLGPGTIIVTDKAAGARCRISIDHLVELLMLTDGQIGSPATIVLRQQLERARTECRQYKNQFEHACQTLRIAILRLDGTKRFIHSKEGARIREWLVQEDKKLALM